MEQVRNLTALVSEQTQTLSRSPQTSTSDISREQHVALFQVINKVRMLQGWTTKTAQELDATIRTWGEILNLYRVPIGHYNTLYRRAFDARQRTLTLGGKVPDLDATLLVSMWAGPHGLERELRDLDVQTGRTLAANAESVCSQCGGSGWKQVGEGRKAPVTKCDHQ